MATQSHRSNGPRGPTAAGPPESSPQRGLPRSLATATNALGEWSEGEYVTVLDSSGAKAGSRKAILLLLMLLGVLLGASSEALAIDCVADAGGIIDGFVNYPVPPPQLHLDGPCTIRDDPASNPLTSNISCFLHNPQR